MFSNWLIYPYIYGHKWWESKESVGILLWGKRGDSKKEAAQISIFLQLDKFLFLNSYWLLKIHFELDNAQSSILT